MRGRTGNVSKLPSGRWSVRITGPDGRRRRLRETFATEVEAARVSDLMVNATAGEHRTLLAYGPGWLDRRELRKDRAIASLRSLWRTWIEPSTVATKPLRLVTRLDVKRWIAELRGKRARQTAQNALNLLRAMFADALEEGLLVANPAEGVLVPKGLPRTEEPWTYLQPDEIAGVLGAVEGEVRDVVAFAIGSGLRAGELVSLRLADVRVEDPSPHVVVRYGGPPARPTKTGKIRTVPLFGLALAAARSQVARLDESARLLWPSLRGGFRSKNRVLGRRHLGQGKYREIWLDVLEAAAISRGVRWHDLRHTCASACVSGWWGRRWTLEEVASLLGHASITTTQRYAHLGETALRTAARETQGPAIGHDSATGAEPDHESTGIQRPRQDSDLRPSV